MRGISRALLTTGLFCWANIAVADSRSQILTVTAHAHTTQVRSGEAVVLDAVIENGTDHAVAIFRSPNADVEPRFAAAFAIKLVTPAGAVQQANTLNHGSGGPLPINPGSEVKEHILLSSRFDMSAPGAYTVQVSPYEKVGTDLDAHSWSNPVVITVEK